MLALQLGSWSCITAATPVLVGPVARSEMPPLLKVRSPLRTLPSTLGAAQVAAGATRRRHWAGSRRWPGRGRACRKSNCAAPAGRAAAPTTAAARMFSAFHEESAAVSLTCPDPGGAMVYVVPAIAGNPPALGVRRPGSGVTPQAPHARRPATPAGPGVAQQARGAQREIVSARRRRGPLEGEQRLHHRRVAIEPAVGWRPRASYSPLTW